MASDNFNPQTAWNVGCQCVSLNYQTCDFPMRINAAKFTQNGGCGYVLKPDHLRVPGCPHDRYPTKTSLRVKIISASQIPKPKLSKKGEVIDPFVELYVTGIPQDTTTKPVKTKVVNDNGFNPVWKDEFTFPIDCVELALLTLRVVDKDPATDDDIAEATIPVASLRQGYRSVPLNNIYTDERIPYAALFCHFKIETVSN
eukprot:NODE_714_length_822_cov_1231.768435_g468_i0.p1 GENE.NODE_714_length_822_cov_1231.768435_g468_i0~~NODE_714_length_822_cov_1231.768435_g468_i0.p1  ORF type:complete len:200 (-),score=47.76 NODE_714_length_822_cov_1231.768435_g468_i0:88-687(-)